MQQPPKKLLDQVRDAIRIKHDKKSSNTLVQIDRFLYAVAMLVFSSQGEPVN